MAEDNRVQAPLLKGDYPNFWSTNCSFCSKSPHRSGSCEIQSQLCFANVSLYGMNDELPPSPELSRLLGSGTILQDIANRLGLDEKAHLPECCPEQPQSTEVFCSSHQVGTQKNMKALIKNHFLCNDMIFEVAKKLGDRIITTDGNTFFFHHFHPILSELAQRIFDFVSYSHLPYHAAWDICEQLGMEPEQVYSEEWEDAIASLIEWGLIEEIPEVQYRYRLSRNSVIQAKTLTQE